MTKAPKKTRRVRPSKAYKTVPVKTETFLASAKKAFRKHKATMVKLK